MDYNPRSERRIALLYLIWFFLHLSFFFFAEESPDSIKFWPYNTQGLSMENTYDISEFLTYTSIPLLLITITRLFLANRTHTAHTHARRHNNMGYFIAFLEEKIKVEERDQQINELKGNPVNYTLLNELKKDKETACTHGVKTWMERLAVKDKYKDYEQDYT
jgi:hypothetical protein